MISLKEFLGGADWIMVPLIHQHNIEDFLPKLNLLRAVYGKPMYVSSGYRFYEDHLRIYKSKGIPESKIPWGSLHLQGLACDFADPYGHLAAYCKANCKNPTHPIVVEGLYFEDFNHTRGWVHVQAKPPRSGKRIFIP